MPAPLAVNAALLRCPTPEGRRWLAFDDPIEQLTAWRLDEVMPVLERAEAACGRGCWAVGYVAYEAGPAFDPAVSARRLEQLPLAAFGVFEQPRPSRGPAGGPFSIGPLSATRSRPGHRADLERIHRHIAEGDTYQVNHTFRLRAGFSGDPRGLFAALGRAQRADHHAELDLGPVVICSASPELFLRRTGATVEARPMKGTRPRHPDAQTDRSLADQLVASTKDRAENTMIVDMVRNDLGRVAEAGTVRVPSLHVVETYPTVHQLTSTVTAETTAPLTELFRACFPPASITGAPKVAATGLIAELETTARGVYTGAIGSMAPDGGIEFNVAIRTAVVDREAGTVEYGVGGGIVWDSEPDREWAEAHDKAAVLTRAGIPFRLLETMRWEPAAGAVLGDRHVDRLMASAHHFGFDVDETALRRQLSAFTADGPLLLRVLVAADGAIEVDPRPLPETTEAHVVFDDRPVASDDEFLRHKTTRRERYDEARARHPDADDVLLFNERGEVTEATTANLVIERAGRLLTPDARCGLLPGTFRAELLEAGTVSTAVLTIDDVAAADEIHLVNSVRGWRPAALGSPVAGPVPRTDSW